MEECKWGNFGDDWGKEWWCLVRIVWEEDEVMRKLREICVDCVGGVRIRVKCWWGIVDVEGIWKLEVDG